MMKKRKDSGFTLIELMIVIAVIGILAIVLVPKIGTVKAQAKETGLDSNIRVVQGYAESKINKWNANPTVLIADVQDDIVAAFTGDNKALTNPITSLTTTAAKGTTPANESLYVLTGAEDAGSTKVGTILVEVTDKTASTPFMIDISAYDENGVEITEKAVTVIP